MSVQRDSRHIRALLLYIFIIALTYSPVIFAGRTLSPASIQPHGILDGTGHAKGAVDGNGGTPSLSANTQRAPVNSFNVDMATPAYYEWPVNRTVGSIYLSGELPLWNPYQAAGTPLLADYSTRALFPYQVLEDISPASFADLFLLGRPVIAAFFTYLFLSALGLSFVPAFFGGLLYMLSGVFSWFLTLEQFANVAMALPVLLLSTELLVQRRGLAYVAFASSAFALIILAGQPEVALYALLLGATYTLVQSFLRYRKSPALLAGVLLKAVGAMVIGLMLSAPLIVPFLEYVKSGFNLHPPGAGTGTEYVANWRMLLSALVPGATLVPADPSITPEALAYMKEGTGGFYYRVFATKGLWDWLGGSTGVVAPLLSITGLLITAGCFIKGQRVRFGGHALFFSAFAASILLKNFGVRPFLWLGYLPLFDQAWSPRWAGPAWVFALCAAGATGLQLLTSATGRPQRLSPNTPPGASGAADMSEQSLSTDYTRHFIFAFLAMLSVLVFIALPSVLTLISKSGQLFSPAVVPYVPGAIGLSHVVTIALLFTALLLALRCAKEGNRLAVLLCAVAVLELWWAIPRGYGPDGLYLQLIPLAAGLFGLLAALFYKKRLPAVVTLTAALFLAGTLVIDSASQNGLRDRKDDFAAPPYVGFIKARPGKPRVMGAYGVLMPNYAGSLGLFDLHYINALTLAGLGEFRYRFLQSPIDGEDTTSPLLWFTGMPQRITIQKEDHAAGAHYRVVERPVEHDLLKHLPYYSLMGVRYLLRPKGFALSPQFASGFAAANIELVYDAEIKIFENRGAFDRAFMLHPFKDRAAFDTAYAGVAKEGRPAVTIGKEVLERMQNAIANDKKTGITTPAKITEYSANSLTIETGSTTPGILIVTDAFAPGWRAHVDNAQEPILPVNGFVRGVLVDSGSHTVRFTYHAPGFATGVRLFFAGLGISVLLLFSGTIGRGRKKHTI